MIKGCGCLALSQYLSQHSGCCFCVLIITDVTLCVWGGGWRGVPVRIGFRFVAIVHRAVRFSRLISCRVDCSLSAFRRRWWSQADSAAGSGRRRATAGPRGRGLCVPRDNARRDEILSVAQRGDDACAE